LGFWNSEEMVKQLLQFNKDRNLTIFDMLTMMEDFRRSKAEGKNELTLSIPPSHLVSPSPKKKRAPRKTKPIQIRQPTVRTQTAQQAQPPPPSSQAVLKPKQNLPDRETPVDANGRWPTSELLLQQPYVPFLSAFQSLYPSPEDPEDYPELVEMHQDNTCFPKIPQEPKTFHKHSLMRGMNSPTQAALEDFQNPVEYFDAGYGDSFSTVPQEAGLGLQPFPNRLSNPSFLARDTQPFENQKKFQDFQGQPQPYEHTISQAIPFNREPVSEVPIDPALLLIDAPKSTRQKDFVVFQDDPKSAKPRDPRLPPSKVLQDVTNLPNDRALPQRASEEVPSLAPRMSADTQAASPRIRKDHKKGWRKRVLQEKLFESTFPPTSASRVTNGHFQEQTATLNAAASQGGARAVLNEAHRVAKRKPEDQLESENVQRQKICGKEPPPFPTGRSGAAPPQLPNENEFLPTEFGLDQVHTEPFGSAETFVIVPTVPSYIDKNLGYKITDDLHEPQHFDPVKPRTYVEYLARQHAFSVLRPQDTEYSPMPPMQQIDAWNLWLNSKLASDSELPALFRDFTYKQTKAPSSQDVSLLARCVRFAQSDAQKEIDWRANPAHVHEIIQRTNAYGLELLISREQVFVKSPISRQDFELIMAIRTVHILWQQQDRTQHVAADIPGIIQMLHEQNPCLPEFLDVILEQGDDELLGKFVKEMCDQFMQSYPEVGRNSVPFYEERLAQEDPNSANAHMFRYLIDMATQDCTDVAKIGDDGSADIREDMNLPEDHDIPKFGDDVDADIESFMNWPIEEDTMLWHDNRG
jgi:hypothetical protein